MKLILVRVMDIVGVSIPGVAAPANTAAALLIPVQTTVLAPVPAVVVLPV